jgi:hypothetical protein
MGRTFRLGLVSAAVALAACWTEPGDVTRVGDTVHGSGTIRRLDAGGVFYVIRGDDERTYTPLELAPEFQRDRLRVRFDARLRPDILALVITGELVEILAIERAWPHPPTP